MNHHHGPYGILRPLRILWLCVPVLCATAHAATPPLTAQEQAQVDTMVSNVVKGCMDYETAHRKSLSSSGAPNAAIPSDPKPYCDCVGQRLRAGATPEFVRGGAPDRGPKLSAAASSHCAAEQFKQTFPQVCKGMMRDFSALHRSQAVPQEKQDQACACIQVKVDEVNGETFPTVAKSTFEDYQRWQRAPSAPVVESPGSLIGTYLRCFQQAGVTSAPVAPR